MQFVAEIVTLKRYLFAPWRKTGTVEPLIHKHQLFIQGRIRSFPSWAVAERCMGKKLCAGGLWTIYEFSNWRQPEVMRVLLAGGGCKVIQTLWTRAVFRPARWPSFAGALVESVDRFVARWLPTNQDRCRVHVLLRICGPGSFDFAAARGAESAAQNLSTPYKTSVCWMN